jgi:LuxR family maltose regulon positive regulatory protein
LTIEPGDGGTRFWAYLRAALEGAGTVGRTLPRPGPVRDDTFLPRLADRLARLTEPVIVVLDDLHHVPDPEVLHGLEFLLRHAAARLHLVIGARREPALPLRRWRLLGELTEVGVRELSFTAEETAQLLARQGVELPRDRVAELHARTEGWPAGVRLASLATRDQSDSPAAAPTTGAADPGVTDYLLAEVLAGQPPHLRAAMLDTSVPDQLCGELVEALTGRPDGAGLLAELSRGDAFLVPVSAEPGWYRYHRMFVEVLRSELHRGTPERAGELHCRAARWLVTAGRPAEALQHALLARDWALAAGVFGGHWYHLVCLDRDPPGAEVTTAPPDEAIRADPQLALAVAAAHLRGPDPSAADGYLRRAAELEHLLAGARRDRFGVLAAALDLAQAQRSGDVEASRSAAARMLELLKPPGGEGPPAALDHGAHAVAHLAIGLAHLVCGEWAAAETALRTGVQHAERAGPADLGNGGPPALNHPDNSSPAARANGQHGPPPTDPQLADPRTADPHLTPPGPAHPHLADPGPAGPRLAAASLAGVRLAGTAWLAVLHALRGELRTAERTARLALAPAMVPGSSRPAHRAGAHLALALVDLQRDRLPDAAAHLAMAEGPGSGADPPGLAALRTLVRAELRKEQGDLIGGYGVLRAGRAEPGGWLPSRYLERQFLATEAELRTAQGDTATVRRQLIPMLDGDPVADAPLAVALARAYLRDDDPAAARRALPDWAAGSSRLPYGLRLSAGLVEALAARRLGDRRGATRTLERVLALAEPEGFRRVFVSAGPPLRDLLLEHLDSGTAYWSLVSELIAASGSGAVPDRSRPSAPGEPLTERELTVLRYLQSILSNLEIAGELSLSVNTVKTHVRNIYRKLDATGRRDAIRKARGLRLL